MTTIFCPSVACLLAGLAASLATGTLQLRRQRGPGPAANNLFDAGYQGHLSRLEYADFNATTGCTGFFNQARSARHGW